MVKASIPTHEELAGPLPPLVYLICTLLASGVEVVWFDSEMVPLPARRQGNPRGSQISASSP